MPFPFGLHLQLNRREVILISSGVLIGAGSCLALTKLFSPKSKPNLLKIITISAGEGDSDELGAEDLELPIVLEREYGDWRTNCLNIDPDASSYLLRLPQDFFNFDEKLLEFAAKHFEAENANLSQYRRALLIGSGTGSLAFQLARYFHEVRAIEKSFSRVVLSHKHLNETEVDFEFPLEGSLRSFKQISTIHHKRDNKIFPFSGKEDYIGLKFINCEPSVLPINLGEFQTALITSQLNEIDNPESLLENIHRVIEINGILIIGSDYNWKRHTNKKLQFANSEIQSSFQFIRTILKLHFDFLEEINLQEVIGESLRSCRLRNHHVTAWRRNKTPVIFDPNN